jgi:hypothetical protein
MILVSVRRTHAFFHEALPLWFALTSPLLGVVAALVFAWLLSA